MRRARGRPARAGGPAPGPLHGRGDEVGAGGLDGLAHDLHGDGLAVHARRAQVHVLARRQRHGRHPAVVLHRPIRLPRACVGRGHPVVHPLGLGERARQDAQHEVALGRAVLERPRARGRLLQEGERQGHRQGVEVDDRPAPPLDLAREVLEERAEVAPASRVGVERPLAAPAPVAVREPRVVARPGERRLEEARVGRAQRLGVEALGRRGHGQEHQKNGPAHPVPSVGCGARIPGPPSLATGRGGAGGSGIPHRPRRDLHEQEELERGVADNARA
jgi:hypothetical protein